MSNNIQAAVEVLIDARDTVQELVKDNDFLKVSVTTKMNSLIGQLGAIGGSTIVTDHIQHTKFEPVTDFMGDDIKTTRKEPITTDDLSPKELERKIFIDKVDKLQGAFGTLTNEQILEANKTDKNVIRGVAKRAGLDDFKEADVNLDFVERIRVALDDQEKAAALKETTDNNLK